MSGSAYDDSNIFARILRDELPSHRVYEDEHTVAFMDVMPQADGHVLVLPKAPSRNILDIGTHELQSLMVAVQHIARAVVKAFDAEGVTVMQFAEPAGGQTVFHTHVHVIPRFEGKALTGHTGKMADNELLADQAFQIRAVLDGGG
jgi:histidine triad (HIT) family protein